jgi:hypothetical protein
VLFRNLEELLTSGGPRRSEISRIDRQSNLKPEVVMPSGAFSGAQDLEEALEEFVLEYQRRAADTISEFLDGWLDHGPERVRLEAKTLEIFEGSSEQIATVLKQALAS